MVNKFQKFLIFISSFLALAVIVLLLKIQGDDKRLLKIKNNIQDYSKIQVDDGQNEMTVTNKKTPDVKADSADNAVPSQPTVQPAIPVPVVTNLAPAPAKTTPDPGKKTRTS